jgi:hypothetical protein
MDITGFFLTFTSGAFVLIGEFIEWSLLIHDKAGWHRRFKSPEGHDNLRPLISTLQAAGIIFLIALVLTPFIIPAFWSIYVVGLIGSSKYWILLFFLSITFSFLWIWHHIVGKKWNLGQGLLAASSVLLFVSYLIVNFYPM